MTYEQISQYMISQFYYGDVNDQEYEALPVTHNLVVLEGVRYVGTDVEIDYLAAKQIVAAPEQE